MSVERPAETELPQIVISESEDKGRESYSNAAWDCYPGIIFAGMVYPCVAATVTLSWLTCEKIIDGSINTIFVINTVGSWFVFSLLGSIVGGFVAGISGWLVALCFGFVMYTLQKPLTSKAYVSCVACLAAFLPLSIYVLDLRPTSFDFKEQMLAILVGPVLAGIVSQVVVCWWIRYDVHDFPSPWVDRTNLRFNILQILAFTAWCGIAFSIFRLSRETNLSFLAMVYILLQLICFGVVSLTTAVFPSNSNDSN